MTLAELRAGTARRAAFGGFGGWFAALCLALAVLLQAAPVNADVAVPPLRSPVTDLTATLSSQERAALEQSLAAFEARKGSQVAVLIVPTTQPESIEQYSIRVAEAWKLGRKGVDDGVILIVAKDDRALRIEVGYGVEGVLPDVIAYRIIEETIKPRFRNGEFYRGIDEGTQRIMQVLDGEPLPPPTRGVRGGAGERSNGGGIGNLLPVLLLFALFGGNILRAMFGRMGAALLTAGGAGVLIWFVTRALAVALLAAVAAFVFVLLSGGGSGGGWSSSRRGGRRGGWGGGSFGGGFGGGGSFGGGGFSGGGGGFGGGGASGRW